MTTRQCSTMQAVLVAALGVAAVLSVVGCAARTQIETEEITAAAAAPIYDYVVVEEFTVDKALVKEVPLETFAERCRQSAIGYLKTKGVFREVRGSADPAPSPKTMIVRGELRDIRIVSGAARFWGGALVGRSHMKVQVELVDADTGKAIHEQELLGAPNAMGSAWSGGATDQGLPEQMGTLVGNYVLAHADEPPRP